MNAVVLDTGEVEPSSAIAALLGHSGPVLLDFDETIYLRNSTEDFIDSARPALLALLAMRMLDLIKPWRWTGGVTTRDVWRVRCITWLFPWTKQLWIKRVLALALDSGNTPLIKAIQKRSLAPNSQATVVATLGFDFIVAPLAVALGLPRIRIIAARSSTFADRRDGKLRMVVSKLGHEAVRRALVLTDSPQDAPLLDVCAVPMRIEWPEARFRPALSDHYLPGQYLSVVKRPGERYIARGILQEDFALWVLASMALATQPIVHVVALLFLLLSFWAVYESGYVDNDRIAARYEHDPKLTGAFREAVVATPRITPWIWALTSGAVGVLLLRGLTSNALTDFFLWTAMLAATYGAFAIYNRFDKTTRIWLYSGLQMARSAAFVVLVPIHLIGAVAIGAHVLAKWVPYYIYRAGGKRWPDQSHLLTRLLFFVLLSILLAFAAGSAILWSWSAAALLAWNVLRARHELVAAVFGAARLDKPNSTRPLDRQPLDRQPRTPQ